MMKVNFILSFMLVLVVSGVSIAAIATFDDLTLPPESYWNGADGSGGFCSGGVSFKNNYNPEWASWDGFAYSNITNTAVEGLDGQYNAIAGSGQADSSNYGVAFVGWTEPPTIILNMAQTLQGLYVTNNNYAYYSMLNGDMFAKKFGGSSGNDADWFLLTITGKDAGGNVTGSLDFYLADYRFADNSRDYIVSTWEYVDLASLGAVKNLEFSLNSSDVSTWGMNTPAYFALDTIVPEPATIILMGVGEIILFRRRR
jgi:hypothetical protein